jgi:hypothetical protein
MELETFEPAGGRLSYGGHLPRLHGAETPAFTHDGIEALREIIKDQIDRAR